MQSVDVFPIAAFCFLVSGVAFWIAVLRVEAIRSSAAEKHALPSAPSLITGTVVLWLWSEEHQRLKDKILTVAIITYRAFLIPAVLYFLASFFGFA